MNNFQMLPKRCHEDFLILKNPVYMRFFKLYDLFPLHGSGWFGGYIVNNSVYMFYFIYDTA